MDVTDLANKYDCSRSEAQKQDESQRITIISLQGDVKNVQRQLEQKTYELRILLCMCVCMCVCMSVRMFMRINMRSTNEIIYIVR